MATEATRTTGGSRDRAREKRVPKAARPPSSPPASKNIKVMVYVPRAMRRAMAEVALELGCTKSAVYVDAAAAYLRLRGDARRRDGSGLPEASRSTAPADLELPGLLSATAAQAETLDAMLERLATADAERGELIRRMIKLEEAVSAIARRIDATSPRHDETKPVSSERRVPARTRGTRAAKPDKAAAMPEPRHLPNGAVDQEDQLNAPPEESLRKRPRSPGEASLRVQAEQAMLAALRAAGLDGLTGGEVNDVLAAAGLPGWAAAEGKVGLKRSGRAVRNENGRWTMVPHSSAASSRPSSRKTQV
ncbi:hypothetical protein [Methylobacterium sp. 1030]|uniref:hypothetical protein n=1 Tax=Methylobacterium sp. 1030 TaxID=3156404 RepID=UPI003392D642